MPQLSQPHAVLACLVLVMAADGPPSADERAQALTLVAPLPAFAGHDMAAHLAQSEALARDILSTDEGVASLLELAAAALDGPARELTYALAAEQVLANAKLTPEELRVLDRLAEHFGIDRLTRAAIDRAARIRWLAAPLEETQ